MSALDEIHELENQIHDLIKRGKDSKLKRAQAEDNITKIQAAIDGALAKVTLHTGNVRHMRKVADLVDLPEYRKTLKHLESAETTLKDARQMLAGAQSTVKECDSVLVGIEQDLAKARKRLSDYGHVIQFPARAPA